ncbi:barstar family protein [Brevibacillus ruminantium]|uniref:Barstar family protein n=1 Tax=Brevibacillus ruminantium TaxID=2950604 RepID=A0ABY4WC34_9BACL|nr:barstar family protein [Brevibacillus ruminantium]USG64623.1 barstar family protein [Brevibacillus ruminantium]
MENLDDEVRAEIVVIDVSVVQNSYELHQLLKRQLSFPNFYGNNWDAFWDAITGLVELPNRLVFIGWDELLVILPRDAKILKECLEDKNKKYPSTFVEVEYR